MQQRQSKNLNLAAQANDNDIHATSGQPADKHLDVGSGEEESPEGLDVQTEAIRHAAEDLPAGSRKEDVPVFDRANRSERL